MKRKYFLLLLILLISISLIACSSFKEGFDDGFESSEEEEEEYNIGIEINFNEHSSGNLHMSVAGKTNLPDGEEVIISVVSEENDYIATSKDIVKDGIYLSEPFSKQGDSLPGGEYKIIVKTVTGDKAKQEEIIKID